MNKRIKKKRFKELFIKCSNCKSYTEYYHENDEQKLCPSCYGELVGLTTEEIWRCI